MPSEPASTYADAVLEPTGSTIEADVVIVGSGMGGSVAAWALRDSGLKVLVVERGDFMPEEVERGSAEAVYLQKRYVNAEKWYDGSNGKPFAPGVYYWVGGNTKVYGAMLPRFRAEDFGVVYHREGVAPAWPFGYDELEPFYTAAEQLFEVHGSLGEDPTEPPHSGAYPHPPLEHEPTIQKLADAFERQGLRPFHAPNAMNLASQADRDLERISDGAPSVGGLKGDAEVRALRPALETGNVTILTRALVTEILTDATGKRATGLRVQRDGRELVISAGTVVLSAGSVNSAVLLLKSTSAAHPAGLANGSGLVGRNYMVHNSTFFMGVNPFRRNRTSWQKTLGLTTGTSRGAGTSSRSGTSRCWASFAVPWPRACARGRRSSCSTWSPIAPWTSISRRRTSPTRTTGFALRATGSSSTGSRTTSRRTGSWCARSPARSARRATRSS